MAATFHLLLGDCLYPDHSALLMEKQAPIVMIEDYSLCTHFRYHKHKLLLFLTAMRKHAKSLESNYCLYYYPLEKASGELDPRSFEDKLNDFRAQHPQYSILRLYEVDDRFMEERLIDWAREHSVQIEWIATPKFLFPLSDFKDYLQNSKKPFLKTYYERQRKALHILIDADGKPTGGAWSYDTENRKKLPTKFSAPNPLAFAADEILDEVKQIVNRQFSEHPGTCRDFRWATDREQALSVLRQFVEEKLDLFGPYEDAFEADQKFLFHSTLSPYLNIGLLSPDEVLQAVLDYYHHHQSSLASVEGFVRQLIGWREFVRGMYRHFNFRQNHFNFKYKLKSTWYEGNTGIPPLDDAIHKLKEEAYNHHIERLMIIGNLMLMSEIDPEEVHRWFMEMYIDSADWVMEANVFGMSQFADGGSFATKPYIAGSNYLRKMSHYPKGDWCDIVDGLYWRFIDTQRETFAKNHRMGMMLGTLAKMAPERKKQIFAAAENWLQKVREV